MHKRPNIILLIVGIFSLWALSAAANGPSLHLAETTYDFGEAEEGTVITHDFSVKNTGLTPLEIKEVRPG